MTQHPRTRLDYVSGQSIIPKDAFGISPSAMYKFFDKPHEWYREMILGEEGFTGNTATFLGTVIHFIAEDFALNQSVDKTEIYKYLFNHLVTDDSIEFPEQDELEELDDYHEMLECLLLEHADRPDIDIHFILDQYRPMGNAIIQYLRNTGIPREVEPMYAGKVQDGYYAAGSIDAINGDCLTDYKTTSTKTPSDKIPYQYKLQLLTYAWICKQNGIDINRIRIVWITNNETGRVSEKTGKPLKDYPSQAIPVTEQITKEDFEFIESLLNLVAESVRATNNHPELTHVIWKDMRLKQPS